MTNQDIIAQADQVIIKTSGRYPVAFVRGQGSTVWDADGKSYTDFLSGLAVCVLGHCHPRVVEAITQQAQTLSGRGPTVALALSDRHLTLTAADKA